MNTFYKVTTALYDTLKAKGFNVVTLGDQYKIDLARQTIFPYAHIIPDDSNISGKIVNYSFRIMGMDLVDFSKKSNDSTFYGNDNMQDVLNDIHNRLNLVVEQFFRGDEFDNLIRLDGDYSLVAFVERFENLLAGWELTINIQIPSEATIC